jgi:hypothetical protein
MTSKISTVVSGVDQLGGVGPLPWFSSCPAAITLSESTVRNPERKSQAEGLAFLISDVREYR